jgi:hypothetical protein
MWKVIRASATGTSHMDTGQACQDDCYADVIRGADQVDYLVCLVADGAGSAQAGGTGAQLACHTARASIKATLARQRPESLGEIDVKSWVENVRRVISNAADESELAVRDYACTLLGAVVAHHAAIFFQIGDGSIVATSGNIQGVVFWPDAGAYANMTYFVTDEDALEHLHICISDSHLDELALFSDGLQRLALSFETQTPHIPFFEPMLNVLRNSRPNQCEALDQQLAVFLNSSAINDRTDDDKTLVLATHRMP